MRFVFVGEDWFVIDHGYLAIAKHKKDGEWITAAIWDGRFAA